MILDILKNNQFVQNNLGDTQGNIWSTKNIDPEFNRGKINISRHMGWSTNTSDESNLTSAPAGFAFSSAVDGNDRYFAVAGDRVWDTTGSRGVTAWSELSSTPTDCDINSDIIAFNSKIYVATQAQLRGSSNGSSFATISGGLSSSPHSMTVYANRLYVSDSNDKVYSMTSGETLSKSGSNTIDLNTTTGAKQLITKIETVSNGIWISTVYTDKAGGEMIFWDGSTEDVASSRYKLPRGVLSMTIKDDRPYIMDSLGIKKVFDGTTFTEISRLPYSFGELKGFNNSSNDRWIHPNGMIVVDDEIYCLIRNTRLESTGSTVQNPLENMPSGVWAFNQRNGLYHKYSFSDTEFAGANTSGTVTDYGSSELVQTGAMFQADATGGSTPDEDELTEFIAGVEYYTDATATSTAFAVTDTDNDIQKGGYLVSAQLQTEQIGEIWQDIVAYVDKFKNTTDKIVVKYRTFEDDPIYATGYWSEDDILRSDTALTTVSNGDEVEILRGKGAGLCSKITSITNDNRMVLKDTIAGMGGTCSFRVQKWKEIDRIDNQSTFVKSMTLSANTGAWAQFKIFAVGTGKSPQLQRLTVVSKDDALFTN